MGVKLHLDKGFNTDENKIWNNLILPFLLMTKYTVNLDC